MLSIISLWVVLALAAFTALGWLWSEGGWWANWNSVGNGSTPLDVIKASLTTIGGIGGTAYLVIRYRERASAERNEAEQKLLNAVQQLGSESPQVRIAGVYSLADVADTYRGDYRQRVVNILCGYLRAPRGTWETNPDAGSCIDETSLNEVYWSDDGAVESTVLDALSRHLRKRRKKTDTRDAVAQDVADDQLWCDCVIDLHDAVISESAALDHLSFDNEVNFRATTFLRAATFTQSTFGAVLNAQGAQFVGFGDFRQVTFESNANLSSTKFRRTANFQASTFEGDCTFSDSIIRKAKFNLTNFNGATLFRRTLFEETADYALSEFIVAEFEGSVFSHGAIFVHTKFRQHVDFKKVTFFGRGTPTTFKNSNIQHATFEGVGFEELIFEDAKFNIEFSEDPRSTFCFPKDLGLERDTSLPPGASWARFDDKGNVIEVLPAERPSPEDEPGDVS